MAAAAPAPVPAAGPGTKTPTSPSETKAAAPAETKADPVPIDDDDSSDDDDPPDPTMDDPCQELFKLCDQLRNVLLVKQSQKPPGSIPDPMMMFLNNYIAMLKKCQQTSATVPPAAAAAPTPATIAARKLILLEITSLVDIYTNNRKAILLGPTNTNWLTGQSIVITFGAGKLPADKVKKQKVYLSEIFKEATKLAEAVTEDRMATAQEVLFPNIILLHIYRILRARAPGGTGGRDHKSLEQIVRDLERELGISKGGNLDLGSGGVNLGSIFAKDGFASKVVTQVTETMQQSLGDEVKIPNVSAMFEKLTDGGALTTLQEAVDTVTKSGNPEAGLKSLMTKVVDGKIIQNVLSQMTEEDLSGAAPVRPAPAAPPPAPKAEDLVFADDL